MMLWSSIEKKEAMHVIETTREPSAFDTNVIYKSIYVQL